MCDLRNLLILRSRRAANDSIVARVEIIGAFFTRYVETREKRIRGKAAPGFRKMLNPGYRIAHPSEPARPAWRMTLAQRSISEPIMLGNLSGGGLVAGTMPSRTICWRISGSPWSSLMAV